MEFVCVDTSKEHFFKRRLFEYPKHREFLRCTFPPKTDGGIRWRIPFCHHPPFCAGPQHHNTDGMEPLLRLFEEGGVRACFSGHEHNFPHSRWNGVDYFVTGGGSKIRAGIPDDMRRAHTVSWAAACHFLLVTIDADVMTVRAIGGDADGKVEDITRIDVDGKALAGPIVVDGRR